MARLDRFFLPELMSQVENNGNYYEFSLKLNDSLTGDVESRVVLQG